MMKNKLLAGSFWLSASNITCKVLGIVYLIPWLTMMGDFQDKQYAQALYNVAYLPYALFLTLGTAGFPNGIAKIVAENSSEKKQTRHVYLNGLSLMILIGIVSAILMLIFSPLLSKMSPISNSREGIIAIISLCPSLLIIPILSTIRGYFQGLDLIKQLGISQIIEQIFRIIIILLGTYYIRVISSGSILGAVVISTFASFIGGLFAIAYLVMVGKKKDIVRWRDVLISPFNFFKSNNQVSIQVLKESLPFIFVGSVISVLQFIDQLTLKPVLLNLFHVMDKKNIEILFSLSSANPNKLSAVLLAIVGSIAATSLPIISNSVKTKKNTAEIVSETFNLTYLLLLPMSFVLISISEPVNALFFGYSREGTIYLILTIMSTIIIGLYTISLSIIQSLSFHKVAIKLTFRVILIKLILQVPFLYLFGGYGIPFSTTISFFVVFIQSLSFLKKNYYFKLNKKIALKWITITVTAIVVSIISLVIFINIKHFFTPYTTKSSFILCALVGSLSVMIYGFVYLKLNIKK